eukprot:TRINITY_DN69212_c0_g1_i1.p1 TRINITY_DN69212_c0_g1~~TRINITY_DN69212_c0_g1_i1.p1  ORF type:complete len:264 (-),score=88.84 TRINITY_DN69212_c0_g1_i1:111-902(-)
MSGYDFRDACESGDLDKVKGLIKDVDINETDEYGYTGLHLAAEHGHLKIVEELMAAGCKLDPLVFDSYYLPIHNAVNKGHTEIAKKLINGGCKIDELIYAGACCGCIHLAIMKENKEIFNLLLEKKCDVNLADEINGNSPLYLATTLDQVDTVKKLIAAGADVNLADWDEKTPLHFAAANGFGEVAKVLVDAKATLDANDANGKTPLDLANDVKEDEMITFLKACATGKIPAKAPATKVREARVYKEVIPLEGCGEGCANPNA